MTPMTDKQKKVAARELCELQGWDPKSGDYYTKIYWAKCDIEAAERILLALAVGRESAP